MNSENWVILQLPHRCAACERLGTPTIATNLLEAETLFGTRLSLDSDVVYVRPLCNKHHEELTEEPRHA